MQQRTITQPRILMIDGHQLIPSTLIKQIQKTESKIIQVVNHNQVDIHQTVQANQPIALSIVSLPTADRCDLALLASLKNWLPKAFIAAAITDSCCKSLVYAAGADIVVDQEGCSQQQSQIERILHYIAYAETSVSKAKHVRLLNKRQQQILEHLAEGKSNKEISQTIYLAEGTVKNHITVIFNYLGVTNRTQAAIKVSRRTALPLSCGNL